MLHSVTMVCGSTPGLETRETTTGTSGELIMARVLSEAALPS